MGGGRGCSNRSGTNLDGGGITEGPFSCLFAQWPYWGQAGQVKTAASRSQEKLPKPSVVKPIPWMSYSGRCCQQESISLRMWLLLAAHCTRRQLVTSASVYPKSKVQPTPSSESVWVSQCRWDVALASPKYSCPLSAFCSLTRDQFIKRPLLLSHDCHLCSGAFRERLLKIKEHLHHPYVPVGTAER